MGLAAIGQSYLIIAGQIDLSCGAVSAFAGLLVAVLLQLGWNMWAAIALVLLIGAVWGVCSATLVNELRFQPFIATYAVSSIVRGLAYVITKAKSVPVSNSEFFGLGSNSFLDIKYPIWILITFLIIFSLILKYTTFGRSIYALGGNPTASRLAGIRPKPLLLKLYIISAVLSSLGGIILTSRMHSGVPASSGDLEFDSITASILGGISFSGGSGNMLGTILGIFILQGFNNGLQVMGLSTYWQFVARGLLLIFALTFDGVKSRVVSKS
jgi:ribose/xylose/arabinose/galactoside ABC-type transport system permease subunit